MNEETKFSDPYWLLAKAEDQEIEFVIVLLETVLQKKITQRFEQLVSDNGVVINSILTLSNNKVTEFFIKVSTQQAWELFQKLLTMAADEDFDVVVMPVSSRKKKLLVCDMDSTIVTSETLDDVAGQAGIGEQVSEITDRAMRGEIDFRQALNERLALLNGLSEESFNDLAETLQYNLGAEALLEACKKNAIRTVLVSGGFEPIVKVVAEKLGFDRYVCNRLRISDGKLTGEIIEPIVDASTKLGVLMEECEQLDIKPAQACCIGDGANDLPMLLAVGLGIGFQGKPLLRQALPYQLNSTGLDSILTIMGIA
jgi:phosphoserine phosphatase